MKLRISVESMFMLGFELYGVIVSTSHRNYYNAHEMLLHCSITDKLA